MAKPKQTGQKRDKEIKKRQRRKIKEERKQERKNDSNKGKGFEAMIAYVDENGQLSSTPPDPSKKKEIKVEDIQLGARKEDEGAQLKYLHEGRVSFFNEEKGYGFLKDNSTKESHFFHLNGLLTPVKLNDRVSFQKAKGTKGIDAVSISKLD
jgi:cold shock CspA family protein